MSINYGKNYSLQISIAGKRVAIDPVNIIECSITQSIETALPTLRLTLIDKFNILVHQLPADGLSETIDITISNVNYNGTEIVGLSEFLTENTYNFKVVRRFPQSTSEQTSIYDVSAILDVEGMFSPNYTRDSSGKSIRQWLREVADEMGLSSNISPSLEISDRVLLQPNWTNAQLLRDLRGRLYSALYSDYRVFVSNGYDYRSVFGASGATSKVSRTTLNVLSVEEMAAATVSEKFSVSNLGDGKHKPIMNFSIYDSNALFSKFGSRSQAYTYFDYFANSDVDDIPTNFVEDAVSFENYFSLTVYHLINKGDSGASLSQHYGRSTENDADYAGRAKTLLYGRMSNSSKMWADTWGLSNLQPGSVVQVEFPQSYISDNPMSYQYTGFWLVERVISRLEKSFFTRMLLTRNGVDTDANTTLELATKRKSDVPGRLVPVS